MQKKSFTLVELMIVIAILAILSAIVIFALNPARLFDNFRDSKRVTDIQSINKAIVFMESWNQSGINYGTTTNVYVSLPDSNPSCSAYTLPTLPAGFAYYCKPTSTYKNTDGTGWIPINFTVEGSNKYLSALPIDPVNNSSFFYTYYPGGSYELTAILSNPNKNSINDEGSLTSTFEIGSPNRTWNTPLQRDKGLVGYWKFDEGTGNIVYDSSGYGNHGTITNGSEWTVLSSGYKVLKFDGIDDYVRIEKSESLNINGPGSISLWVNIDMTKVGLSLMFGNNAQSWLSNGISVWSASPTIGGHLSNGIKDLRYAGPATTLLQSNAWGKITFTWDSINARLYLQGLLVSTVPFDGHPLPSATYVYVGGQPTYHLRGFIDGVRIYNRVLSAAEIQKIYNSEKSYYGL